MPPSFCDTLRISASSCRYFMSTSGPFSLMSSNMALSSGSCSSCFIFSCWFSWLTFAASICDYKKFLMESASFVNFISIGTCSGCSERSFAICGFFFTADWFSFTNFTTSEPAPDAPREASRSAGSSSQRTGSPSRTSRRRNLLRMLREKLRDLRVLLHSGLVLLHELHHVVPDRVRHTLVARELNRASILEIDLRRGRHCSVSIALCFKYLSQ